MRISDWGSDVGASDLAARLPAAFVQRPDRGVTEQPGDPAGRAYTPMGVEAVAGGDDAGYVLEAASGAIEGQARGHGFARIDPEVAIHMLAVRPARADRRDDRHPVRAGERIREAGIRPYAPGAPRHGLRGAAREGQIVEPEVGARESVG